MKIFFKANFILIICIFCLNCFAQKDSSSFKNRLSLNFMVIPTYVNSFDSRVPLYTRDHTGNLGHGMRIGIGSEFKFTTRKAIRIGMYHYNEETNFLLSNAEPTNYFDPNNTYGWSYFYKLKQVGFEFPIEYKYSFINKFSKIKIYFVPGLVFSYFYRQNEIILNNGSNIVSDTLITTNKFKNSTLSRLILQVGAKYKISPQANLLFETSYISYNRYLQFNRNSSVAFNYCNYWSLTIGVNYKFLK